jgi:uncharacterized membrane protein
VVAAALLYRGVTGHSYLYQLLGMNTANGSGQSTTGRGASSGNPTFERSITIEKPANELYAFWRDPRNLSRIMGNFAEVTGTSENRTHWVLHIPVINQKPEWDTQYVEERPGELLRWQSVAGSQIPNEGSLSFQKAPADWGTVATLSMRFDPPGGVLGDSVAKALSIAPRIGLEQVLRNFKSLVETGELPTLAHNPSARATSATH